MHSSSVILAMAGMLVLGLVTLVLAGPATDLALKRARKAKRIAKQARSTAHQALTTADQADQGAQRANSRLDGLRVVRGGSTEFQNRVLQIAPRP